MNDQDFDNQLIAAAFLLAADTGWSAVTIAEAAGMAGLSLAEARVRFPGKRALLWRFGQMLDQAALASSSGEGPPRDRLFDLLMGRFEAMKPHREGVRALLRYLPTDPATALQLACATKASMRWMLQAAGQPTHGVRGALRVQGLVAVWTWTLRTFEGDESEDLSATMAVLDKALGRAHGLATWISGGIFGGGRAKEVEPDVSAMPETPDPVVTPAPVVTPDPVVAPDLGNSGPGTPGPGTPGPGTPGPGTPEPGTPEPGTPDPLT